MSTSVDKIKLIAPMMNFVTSDISKFYGVNLRSNPIYEYYFSKHLPLKFSTEELEVILGDNSNPFYNIQREIISNDLIDTIIKSIPKMFSKKDYNPRQLQPINPWILNADNETDNNDLINMNAHLLKTLSKCVVFKLYPDEKLDYNAILTGNYNKQYLANKLDFNYTNLKTNFNNLIDVCLNKSSVLKFFNHYVNIIAQCMDLPEYKDILVKSYIKYYISNHITNSMFYSANESKVTKTFYEITEYIINSLYKYYNDKRASMPNDKVLKPTFEPTVIVYKQNQVSHIEEIMKIHKNPFLRFSKSLDDNIELVPYTSLLFYNADEKNITEYEINNFVCAFRTDINDEGKLNLYPVHIDDSITEFKYKNSVLNVTIDLLKKAYRFYDMQTMLSTLTDKIINPKLNTPLVNYKDIHSLSQDDINLLNIDTNTNN